MIANVRMMYLRSGNLFKDFVIENNKQIVTNTGRVVLNHLGDGSRRLRGCLAEATDEDRTNHSQKNHIITHTIVQAGEPKARRGDKLILMDRNQSESRSFYIVDLDDVGTLGISTIYYAEERFDMK